MHRKIKDLIFVRVLLLLYFRKFFEFKTRNVKIMITPKTGKRDSTDIFKIIVMKHHKSYFYYEIYFLKIIIICIQNVTKMRPVK